ncbi:MAG: hypothetical protein CL565_06965 [Alphaproteobacteria bacterium]|nr:hypothetical protein [Alphaproteobacteria bacterium]
MFSHIRAAGKLVGATLLAVTLIPAQLYIAGPIFKDKETLPHFFWRGLRKILGIKVKFNEAALVSDKPMLYMANHYSVLDPLILASVSKKSAFVAMKEIKNWPLMGKFATSIGTIFASNNRSKDELPEIHEQLTKVLNDGRNVTFCPEGVILDGKNIAPFKTGVISVGYNNLSKKRHLEREIGYQPLSLEISEINGMKIIEDESLRKIFILDKKRSAIGQIWDMLCVSSIKSEITVLDEIKAADYLTPIALAIEARKRILENLEVKQDVTP